MSQETTKTLINAGCDRECKWRAALDGLVADEQAAKANVEQRPDVDSLGNSNGTRPTEAGYDELERIGAESNVMLIQAET